MTGSDTPHLVTYILSIRSEYQHVGFPVFRGTLQVIAGQKFEFSTLAELNSLLCEIGGWIDTPKIINEGGELNESHQAIDVKRYDNKP